MVEKICSNCGSTLLVGLQYCPGCLRAIGRGRTRDVAYPEQSAPPEEILEAKGVDSLFLDVELHLANLFYPVRVFFSRLFNRPMPKRPPSAPTPFGPDTARIAARGANSPAMMSLSGPYTRVVCPKCQHVQRAAPDLPPSALVTCDTCMHSFPGSFATEFRKGADLQCFRCGVITFCVSGLKITTCPNCRFSTERVVAKPKVKPKAAAALLALLFVLGLLQAVHSHTTTQFFVLLCVGIVSCALGFVTMVALGF